MDDRVTQHLRHGERLLWQTQESLSLRALRYVRLRRKLMWLTLVALVYSVAFGLLPLKTINLWIATGKAPVDLPSLLSALFSVAALAGAGLFTWSFLKVGATARSDVGPAQVYVATDQRLYVIDSDGEVREELGRSEISSITRGSKEQPHTLWVDRRNGKPPDDSIPLTALDDPEAVKAKLDTIFLEPES